MACHEHPNGYADGWACGSLLSEINRLGDNIMIAGTAGLSGAVALSALSKSTGKSKVGKLLKTKSFTQILRKNSLVTATAFTAGTGVAVNEMLNSYENTNFDYFYGFDDSFTNNAPDAALLFVAMLAADKFNMTELLTSIMFYFVFIGFMLSVVIPLLPYFFSLNSLKETLTALLEGIIGITVSLMYTIIPSKATRSEYLAQAGMLFVRTILVVVFNVMGLLVAIIAFNLLSMSGFFNIFKPHMSVASLADSIIMIGMLLVLVIMTYKKFNMIFGIVTEAVEQSVFLMKGNFQLSNYQMYMDGLKQADMIAKRAKMNIK